MDWPSGENTGFVMLALEKSPETMTRGLGSDMERTYSFTLATYAMVVPSLEIATSWRPMLLKVSPCSRGIEKRVATGCGGLGHTIQAMSEVRPAAMTTPATNTATVRFQRASGA